MCASYWTIKAPITCPTCGKTDTWELQTHFMGYVGSCQHEYTVGENVDELKGVSVLLDGRIDDFSGNCPNCKVLFALGAEIDKGRVKNVYILEQEQAV